MLGRKRQRSNVFTNERLTDVSRPKQVARSFVCEPCFLFFTRGLQPGVLWRRQSKGPRMSGPSRVRGPERRQSILSLFSLLLTLAANPSSSVDQVCQA